MSITPKQPSFFQQKEAAAIPATDFDNMSNEEIRNLLNGVNKMQGKSARVAPIQQPKPKPVFDLDKFLEEHSNNE